MPADHRPVATILDELAAVERHLVDAPPHSGAGHREDLGRRARQLRRELAAVRRGSAHSSSSVPSTDTNDSISPG